MSEIKQVIEELLDEYLGAGGFEDWRTGDVTRHMLTQSTCLLAVVVLYQRGEFDGLTRMCTATFGTKACVLRRGHGGPMHVSNSGTMWSD